MTKTLVCTVCPNGCEITVTYTSREDAVVEGNRCKRGIAYSLDECFDPKRVFTSSVRIEDGFRRMLPVRTAAPIPKADLMDGAAETKAITVMAPVHCGDVIEKDFLGTGTDLVASMTIEEEVR